MAAAEPSGGPSPAEARGAGAGKVFVLPFPAAQPELRLDPTLFTLHAAAPGSRQAAAPGLEAGKWLALPAAELDLWLEGDGKISPYSVRVIRPAPGAPGVVVPIPVGDAGRVVFEMVAEDGLRPELHLWSAGPFRDRDGQLQGELVRNVPLPMPDDGVAMPAGRAAFGVYSPEAERYLALSRPFEVKKGEKTRVDVDLEEVFAQLVLDLHFPGPAPEGATVDLQQYGAAEPDLIVQSRHRVTAFWYELYPDGEATLAAGAGDYLLPPWRKTIPGASIELEKGPMVPWPALDLELVLPAALNDQELKLAARGPVYETHEELKFTGDYRHAFRRLPLGEIELVLETPLGEVRKKVDFSSGESRRLVWEPELMALEGTVYYDGKPRRSSLFFRLGKATETDGEGRYREELLGEVKMVQVKVEGVPGDPHVEILAEPMTASGRLDIRVPAAVFSVRVIDAASRQGIGAARVELVGTYRLAGKEGAEAPGPLQQLRQNVRTDADGKAWLPPVQPGALQLKASAEDYLESAPLLVEIPAKPEKKEFELRLDRIDDRLPLELKLPGGAPAARAAVALYDPSASFELWRDNADEDGRAEVPAAAGQLVVSGAEAPFLSLSWPPAARTRRLELPAGGGTFLVARVVDRQGRPVDGARIALFLDGRVYHGDFLGSLIQAPPLSGQGGLLALRHLPPRALGLLAYSPLSPGPPAGAQPTQVPFPWPQVVELQLVE